MQSRLSASSDKPGGSSSSPQSPQDPHSLHLKHVRPADPRIRKHLGSSLYDRSGSGSSSSKLPQLSSGVGTTPSSKSLTRTPDVPSTPPPLVDSPPPVSDSQVVKQASLATKSISREESHILREAQGSLPTDELGPSLSSESDEQVAPTRASIRAWAKATPAGPPRYTPSPIGSALLTQSSSDDILERKSITRSAGHQTVSSISPRGKNASSGSGSGSASHSLSGSDGESSGNALFGEESSGNIADAESSGSGSGMASPPDESNPSPSSSPPVRQAVQPQSAPVHAQSSASDSPPPALVISHAHMQDQQGRLGRRQRQPPHHPSRRRHRDRRSRTSNPTPPGPIPEPRLPPLPPPPPLPPRPLRPLQLMTGGVDVLDEISRMLHNSRRPLLRTGVDPGGGLNPPPRRENDVLDDIYFMIHKQRG